MKILLIPSAVSSGRSKQQFMTSYLVNDIVAVDAGSLGLYETPVVQSQVEHVLLSHSHLDHVASLPLFVDNTYDPDGDAITVHANRETLDCLQQDFFNGRVWPDLISGFNDKPLVKLEELHSEQAIRLGTLTVTPIALDHTVPTLGFLLEQNQRCVAIVQDTGPTDLIWQRINEKATQMRASFVETSIPNSMAWLAESAKHLTPASLAEELQKLQVDVPVYVVHLKSRYRNIIEQELHDLGGRSVQIASLGVAYQF